ncbi:hypothetical protein QQ056_11055 [Oscillatoria laete-virens NRMC-F 0139]|nr:hypothetical protein [Oscillatoria laete-virens]MDL5054078.1 hypothetical protein [Oscillatoria laete-virens NRMC-F 0139]
MMTAAARRFFNQMSILLVLYWVTTLIGAVKFLGSDALATVLPYHQSNALASVLLQTALLSGILGASVQVFRIEADRALRLFARLWTAFVIVAGILALLGVTDGRAGLELPPLLDVILIALLAAFCALAARHHTVSEGSSLLWLVGMGSIIAGLLVGLMPSGTFLNDRIFRVIAVGLIQPVGFILTTWTLIMARPGAPSEKSLYFMGGLLAIWGMAMIMTGLQTLIDSPVLTVVSWLSVLALPAVGLIVVRGAFPLAAQHEHPVLIRLMQAALLLASLLGAFHALPLVSPWIIGTRLTDAMHSLIAVAAMTPLLALALPDRRRLAIIFAAGIAVFSAALIVAGVSQVSAERTLGVGYLESQASLVPVYSVWAAGLLIAALATIALGWGPRREQQS